MQQNKFRRFILSSLTAVAAAFWLPAAHASVVVDFESPAIRNVGLFLSGDTFSQSGFDMTVDFDFGLVDNTAGLGLGDVAPSGDSSHYYFQSNQGGLIFTSSNGAPFSLDGFDAAYVPLIPGPAQDIVLVAFAQDMDGNSFGTAFALGSGNGTAQSFPFLRFSDTRDFSSFTNLQQVEFFACAQGSSPCDTPADNNAQFALDNVVLTPAVPEPTSAALLSLGLIGVRAAVARRRRNPR